MTSKNYEMEPLMLNEILPVDEWQNSTLTADKIVMLMGQYIHLLDNEEIHKINQAFENDSELNKSASDVRHYSQKGGEENRAKMQEALKKSLFRQYYIVANYAMKYIPNATSQKTSKKLNSK